MQQGPTLLAETHSAEQRPTLLAETHSTKQRPTPLEDTHSTKQRSVLLAETHSTEQRPSLVVHPLCGTKTHSTDLKLTLPIQKDDHTHLTPLSKNTRHFAFHNYDFFPIFSKIFFDF